MYVYTEIVIDLMTGTVIDHTGFPYDGPVALCKGATSQEKDQAAAQTKLFNAQTDYYNVTVANAQQVFKGQQAILDTIDAVFEPIFKEGGQGLTAVEKADFETQAVEGTHTGYQNAKMALAESQATAGGDAYIPKGATTQANAELMSAAMRQKQDQELQIREADAKLKRESFTQAANMLGGVAGQMNSVGWSGSATGAGSSAATSGSDTFASLKAIQEQDRADSFGVVAGGLAGAALGAAGNIFKMAV